MIRYLYRLIEPAEPFAIPTPSMLSAVDWRSFGWATDYWGDNLPDPDKGAADAIDQGL